MVHYLGTEREAVVVERNRALEANIELAAVLAGQIFPDKSY